MVAELIPVKYDSGLKSYRVPGMPAHSSPVSAAFSAVTSAILNHGIVVLWYSLPLFTPNSLFL